MKTTKRVLAVVMALFCMVMPMSVFAEPAETCVICGSDAHLQDTHVCPDCGMFGHDAGYCVMPIEDEEIALDVSEEAPVEKVPTEEPVVEAVEETADADRTSGMASFIESIDAEAAAKAEAEEAERVAALTPEELAKEEADKTAQEASDAELDIATTYLSSDYFRPAIQKDENVKENTAIAVEVVRENGGNPHYATIWSILPAIIAIVLALITKEVYSSLFVGILSGGLIYANFNFEGTLNHIVSDGFVASLSSAYNVGILIFLVLLGALVAMMNKAGGSAAFGRWASTHIKSRVGAQLATIALGVLIFVDDYFNCLTVGSVMRPVCDAKKISRAKLSYLIDSTAAPICIIAPISSWAAAVAGFAPEGVNGIEYFIKAIPFNYYALLTIVTMIVIAVLKFDFGPMKIHEKNAEEKGDIFTTLKETAGAQNEEKVNEKGKVIDLVLPVIILIVCCIIGMIYSGGFFSGESFIDAFSSCDASVGLALGSLVAIILVAIYFILFRHGVIKFSDLMGCLPDGFKAMVPAILILTFAWTLKGMTDSLGADIFIANFVNNNASSLVNFLPAIIFLIAIGLSFSTGTSWGTFGILIPIVLAVFAKDPTMQVIGMSACMAGAVCGDHCSPISDTTIMSSAGAQCNHVNHVSTQLPYALTVAAVSFVSYIVAGFVQNVFVSLAVAVVLMIATLFVFKKLTAKK